MKRNTSKGFTLIELIMVIVILGILAAVAVPKFFSFQDKALIAAEKGYIGNLKSGLNTYAANQIVNGSGRAYPKSDLVNITQFLTAITDDADSTDWAWSAGVLSTSAATLTYTAPSSNVIYYYDCTGAVDADYTLSKTNPY